MDVLHERRVFRVHDDLVMPGDAGAVVVEFGGAVASWRRGPGRAPPHARPDPPPRLFSSNRFTLDPERARRIGSSDDAGGGGSNNDIRLLDSEGGGTVRRKVRSALTGESLSI